jgi:hypothetical protein
MLCAARPEYNEKISVLALMGPVRAMVDESDAALLYGIHQTASWTAAAAAAVAAAMATATADLVPCTSQQLFTSRAIVDASPDSRLHLQVVPVCLLLQCVFVDFMQSSFLKVFTNEINQVGPALCWQCNMVQRWFRINGYMRRPGTCRGSSACGIGIDKQPKYVHGWKVNPNAHES